MSWLRSELQWIPRPAWIVATTVFVVPLIALVVIIGQAARGHAAATSAWIMVPFAVLTPLFVLYVLLVGYVYGDARRRGMRQVLWTLLAIFVPNGIGILIYFLMRQKPNVACHRCSVLLQPGLSFCPNCGSSMGPVCPQCQRLTETGWSHCGHCGATLPVSSPLLVPRL
jgi:RNA polymerase subunit RPABC4/transcription elongation factor Spt4